MTNEIRRDMNIRTANACLALAKVMKAEGVDSYKFYLKQARQAIELAMAIKVSKPLVISSSQCDETVIYDIAA